MEEDGLASVNLDLPTTALRYNMAERYNLLLLFSADCISETFSQHPIYFGFLLLPEVRKTDKRQV